MRTTSTFEFHVSRQARDRYRFDAAIFSMTGNVVFGNPTAARRFAQLMDKVRGVERDPAKSARPAELYTMGLIDEALHALITLFRQRFDPRVMTDAVGWFESRLGPDALSKVLTSFVEAFPPTVVYNKEVSAEEWLRGQTDQHPHRAVALEELLMLHLANSNPAYSRYAELFDESLLRDTAYKEVTRRLPEYFHSRPRFGNRNATLFEVLIAPAKASPNSLAGQLLFLQKEFPEELAGMIEHFLRALDVIKEEEVAIWTLFHPPGQQRQHPTPLFMGGRSGIEFAPFFGYKGAEYEAFSPDVHWMPTTVMLAKTTFVWLDQLSKQYQRSIRRLNQVPDDELRTMASRGFNALWLIGIWERSTASRTIKQMTGNADAAASAYSLRGYSIAEELGGHSAYENLRDRAARYGIRLASDMVPNHMGIDSEWVTNHPNWFISLPDSPFPAYSFNGPDLSHDNRVEIKIEDHYYDRSDAAVVFRRTDRWTGDSRYIYHGNDGTSFPWNDTAQLDYLNPEVREAVIQTIIHVAKMFPIIRFDAAMTLTKQHYQRLWFPAPGTGGAIPSRAEHGLTKAEFDRAMPNEFWREVVDRIAVEVPGTLLLAEAFWLLEGYFVRTLGMHRVYNSAFMNMMRDEENANYRTLIKNTLEFDPEVLKRYVNFMNNPDERTAVDQFGKGDKYFGVCTLLATLPGLPMFGHGQLEGFSERYGMEFRRALRDEQPDQWLVGRHEREISPLLHRRYVFAEVENFLLYDFFRESGGVDENVFAYSNRSGNDRGFVIFHNRYGDTQGWIRMSCAYAEKQTDGTKTMRQRPLAEGLAIGRDEDLFVAYRDLYNGQEFLQRARDIADKGLFFRLGAYQCSVLMDFRDIRDDASQSWSQLCDYLGGRGVQSLEDEFRWMQLRPLHHSLEAALDLDLIRRVFYESGTAYAGPPEKGFAGQPPALTDEATVPSKTSGKKSAAKKSAKAAKKTSAKSAKTTAPSLTSAKRANSARPADLSSDAEKELLSRAEAFYNRVEQMSAAGLFSAGDSPAFKASASTRNFSTRLEALLRLPQVFESLDRPMLSGASRVFPVASAKRAPDVKLWVPIVAWALLDSLCAGFGKAASYALVVRLFDDCRFRNIIGALFGREGFEGDDAWRAAARIRFAFAHSATTDLPKRSTLAAGPIDWINDPEIAWLIGMHEYQGIRYFNKELFEDLLWWTELRGLTEAASRDRIDTAQIQQTEKKIIARAKAAEQSGYSLEKLLDVATLSE